MKLAGGAKVPAVTLKESLRLSKAAQGHENNLPTPQTHTFDTLKVCIMKTQTVCFSDFRKVIDPTCGSAGAASYVRETRVTFL